MVREIAVRTKDAYLTGGDGDLRVHEPDGARGDVDAEHGGRVVDGHGQLAVERDQLRRHPGAVRAFPGVEVVHCQALHTCMEHTAIFNL